MKILILLTLLLCSSFAFTQTGIGIGTTTPNANAVLDIKSGNKGVLLPRMDSVARKAIPNTKGLLVYDSTYNSYYFNTGAAWQKIPVGNGGAQVVPNGANPGDILYWDGAGWNANAAGKPGQYLQLDANKKPTWVGDQYPVITTSAVSNISDSSARLGLILVSAGIETIGDFKDFEKGICLGTSINPTPASYNYVSDTAALAGAYYYNVGTDNFYSTGRLLVNTTYYVRAFAQNNSGIVYGNQVSFKTLNGTVYKPRINYSSFPDSISSSSVVLSNNVVVSNGGAMVTARGIVWSPSPSPTIANSSKTIDGSGDGYFNFYSKLTGLLPNTTYYYRAYATNSAGTGYSDEYNFTTMP